MIRASIDIGSNSTILQVCRLEDGKISADLKTIVEITSLGKGLAQTGAFSEESMEKTFKALRSFAEILHKEFSMQASQAIATATEAARVATNSKQFFERVKQELKINVQLISGEAEAFYTTLGVVGTSKVSAQSEQAVIMDIGGASCEIISVNGTNSEINKSVSLPIGAARAADWLSLGTYEKELESVFDSHDLSQFSSENVICVAGTMTSLARMIHQQDNNSEASIDDIEGMEIETSKLENFSDLMESRSSEDLLAEFSFLKARSQTIAAGAKAALAVLLKVGCKTVCISTKGLRHGTIICGGIDERYKI